VPECRKLVVTCEIKHCNNFKIISKSFYFSCNHGLIYSLTNLGRFRLGLGSSILEKHFSAACFELVLLEFPDYLMLHNAMVTCEMKLF